MQKINTVATEPLLKWEHLLQDGFMDILIEALDFIF